MFFDVNLLCRQGSFSLEWRAAICGVKKLSKSKILSVDVAKSCDDILLKVLTGSMVPRQRFSLKLSAQLSNGLIRIYASQVELFRITVSKLLIEVEKRGKFQSWKSVLQSSTDADSPEINIRKPRAKKRSIVQEDFPEPITDERIRQLVEGEFQMPVVEDVSVIAHIDDITIKEVDVPRARLFDEEEAFLGDFGDASNLQHLFDQHSTANLLQTNITSNLEIAVHQGKRRAEEEIHHTHPKLLSSSSSEDISVARKIEVVVADIHAPLEPLATETQRPLVTEAAQPERQLTQEPEALILEDVARIETTHTRRDSKMPPPTIIPKNRKRNDIVIVRKKHVLIDRETDEIETRVTVTRTLDIFDYQNSIINEIVRDCVPDYLRDDYNLDVRPEVSALEEPTIEPAQSRRQTQEHVSFDKPRLIDPLIASFEVTPNIHIESDLVVPDLEPQRTSFFAVDLEVLQEISHKQMEKDILKEIIQLKNDSHVTVTIKDIATKPLTKRSVAHAFHNLLSLQKKRYVEFYLKENSIDLERIELGSKSLEQLAAH